MIEIKFNNVKIPNSDLFNNFFKIYINSEENLMKLTLSNMNLRSNSILQNLIIII